MPRVTVVYDGSCSLCRRSVRFLHRFDSQKRLDLADGTEWDRIAERFPDLECDRFREELLVVLPDGRVVSGFDAAAPLLQRLPSFRWLAPLLAVPGVRGLGRRIYRAIARRRHGLSP